MSRATGAPQVASSVTWPSGVKVTAAGAPAADSEYASTPPTPAAAARSGLGPPRSSRSRTLPGVGREPARWERQAGNRGRPDVDRHDACTGARRGERRVVADRGRHRAGVRGGHHRDHAPLRRAEPLDVGGKASHWEPAQDAVVDAVPIEIVEVGPVTHHGIDDVAQIHQHQAATPGGEQPEVEDIQRGGVDVTPAPPRSTRKRSAGESGRRGDRRGRRCRDRSCRPDPARCP